MNVYHFFRKNIFMIIIAIVIIITIIFSQESFQSAEESGEDNQVALTLKHDVTEDVEDETNLPKEDEHVVVDIKGEIHKPGVYEVRADSRVIDVIEVAGGFTKKANENQLNLAQKVIDEMVIVVLSIDDDVDASTDHFASFYDETTEGVPINKATKAEIETLNGIGPSKADAIIQYREENGPFQTVEDLLQVNGIGEKTLENMKDDIIVP